MMIYTSYLFQRKLLDTQCIFSLGIIEIADMANLGLSSHSFTAPPGILSWDSEAASHTLDLAHSPQFQVGKLKKETRKKNCNTKK